LPHRLRSRYPAWEKLTNDPTVLSAIKDGFQLPWDVTKGPAPACHKVNGPGSVKYKEFLDAAIAEAKAAGVLAPIKREDAICIMALNVAENKGKKRMVFNCRHVNAYLWFLTFKYESLTYHGRLAFSGASAGWCTDIRKCFYHYALHPSSVPYLCCEWNGEVLAFQTLPFGVACAPEFVTRVHSKFLSFWRRQQALRVIGYLDDFGGGAVSAERAKRDLQFVLQHLQDLGFLVAWDKTFGLDEPITEMLVLGMVIDFKSQRFVCPAARVQQIFELAAAFLPDNEKPHKVKRPAHLRAFASSERTRAEDKSVARLVGLIASATLAFGVQARLRTRSCNAVLNSRLGIDPETGEKESTRDPGTWGRMVTFSEEALDECRWWVSNINKDKVNGRPLITAHPTMVWEVQLSTDGSATGWGAFAAAPPGRCPQQRNAFLENVVRRAPPSVSRRAALRAGQTGIELVGSFTPEVCKTSSTLRELVGGTESVETMGELLRDATMEMKFDSQGATFVTGGTVPGFEDKFYGGSRVVEQQRLAIRLHDAAESVNCTVLPRWVPRSENIRADALSHVMEFLPHYDYGLRPRVFRKVEKAWGPFTVDAFASSHSARLPRFWTKFHTPEAEWCNAFSASWALERVFAFPDPNLVGEVISRLRMDQGQCTLIVPRWTSAPWFPLLYPEGAQRPPAPFVRETRMLGPASAVLCYPETRPVPDAARHLPKGSILALYLNFNGSASY
jgi:hypothetical protein